eukprot:TRINITY_DN1845_c0_g3_i2.p2 TRINITY_DN1845_c0_g3~~TRINITY_DN1845_c0_g3_i2.p2  ORF type:complete len:226 (-),score=81.77 TRINITY_DN1845_c0_g3_i2:276-953(-)
MASTQQQQQHDSTTSTLQQSTYTNPNVFLIELWQLKERKSQLQFKLHKLQQLKDSGSATNTPPRGRRRSGLVSSSPKAQMDRATQQLYGIEHTARTFKQMACDAYRQREKEKVTRELIRRRAYRAMIAKQQLEQQQQLLQLEQQQEQQQQQKQQQSTAVAVAAAAVSIAASDALCATTKPTTSPLAVSCSVEERLAQPQSAVVPPTPTRTLRLQHPAGATVAQPV